MSVTVSTVSRSIRRFSDYAGDLINSDFNTFEDRLNMFFSFCESDSVFSTIHNQLTNMPSVNLETWFKERLETVGGMAGSGDLSFPTDQEQRLALMYQLLYGIRNNQISWRGIAQNFFAIGSSRYDDYLYALHQAVTLPMMRELGYRLEELQEGLPSDSSAPVPQATFQIIHHAQNVIQQNAIGNGISQSASQVVTGPAAELFGELRKLIDSESTSKEADLELVKAAEKEAQPGGSKTVAKALLTGLSVAASAGGIISAIIDLIG